jgi:hypothetical protein
MNHLRYAKDQCMQVYKRATISTLETIKAPRAYAMQSCSLVCHECTQKKRNKYMKVTKRSKRDEMSTERARRQR